jgi:hypothetical protein
MASSPSSHPFRIGRSNTGLGLFATDPIARGDVIVTYGGKRIPTKTAREKERRSGAKYMFEIDERWTIDGSARSNLGRYVNHSCRPNSEAELRNGRIVFVARRAIAPGEEITLDYGDEYFDLYIRDIGCRCAACAKRRARAAGRRPKR